MAPSLVDDQGAVWNQFRGLLRNGPREERVPAAAEQQDGRTNERQHRPRIERQLRQSLQLADGDWTGLFTEPVAIITYALMLILLLIPLILRLMHRSEETLLVVEDDRDMQEKAAKS